MGTIEKLRQLFVKGIDKATFYMIKPHRLFLRGMDIGYRDTLARPHIFITIILSLWPFVMLAFYAWQGLKDPRVW